jgi:hypothetical protein
MDIYYGQLYVYLHVVRFIYAHDRYQRGAVLVSMEYILTGFAQENKSAKNWKIRTTTSRYLACYVLYEILCSSMYTVQ